jgi:hypothetical protein
MERHLVADAECNETLQPGKRCIARGPVDDIAFPEKKARPVMPAMSATLPDDLAITYTARYMARSPTAFAATYHSLSGPYSAHSSLLK